MKIFQVVGIKPLWIKDSFKRSFFYDLVNLIFFTTYFDFKFLSVMSEYQGIPGQPGSNPKLTTTLLFRQGWSPNESLRYTKTQNSRVFKLMLSTGEDWSFRLNQENPCRKFLSPTHTKPRSGPSNQGWGTIPEEEGERRRLSEGPGPALTPRGKYKCEQPEKWLPQHYFTLRRCPE